MEILHPKILETVGDEVLKRTTSMILLLALCLNLCACGPSRTRQVENLKALFPEVKQFVDDNIECLQTLLIIKDRIREFNESQEEHWGSHPVQELPADLLPIKRYYIYVSENQIEFEALGYRPSQEEELSMISIEERVLLSETILKMSFEYRSFYITQDDITIPYANSGNTGLRLVSPAVIIEDPGIYSGGGIVEFTEPVNDDWCIIVSRYASTIF